MKSAVGGTFELMDLGVCFHSGEVLDLSFFATPQQLDDSKELRSALEMGHLHQMKSSPSIPTNFRALAREAPPKDPGGSSVRTALFVDVSIPLESVSYRFYVMRDLPTRLNIVNKTQDIELLQSIVANEQSETIVATAQSRLNRLRQT